MPTEHSSLTGTAPEGVFGTERLASPTRGKSYGTQRDTAIKVRGERREELLGFDFSVKDKRKYKYDVMAGLARCKPVELSRDDRMSAEEAGRTLDAIHEVCGLKGANEDVLYSFDHALWLCHTVNSGSVLVPGRSRFCVPGTTMHFDYSIVRDKLGTDIRRFFRAFADDIAQANSEAIRSYDPRDAASAEIWGWIQQVAYDKGLQRYPHLCHDSADACVRIGLSERMAITSAKSQFLDGRPNAVDVPYADRH